MSEYPISWWEYAGRFTEVREGVSSPVMRNIETGEELPGSDLPIGACWDANQPADAEEAKRRRYFYPVGPDGRSIACRLPGPRTWHIDGRASNCTLPGDTDHRCWCRHGSLGDKLHVDKVGNTCAAGAGSIAVEGFHGFLHHGVLRSC